MLRITLLLIEHHFTTVLQLRLTNLAQVIQPQWQVFFHLEHEYSCIKVKAFF